MVYVNVNSHKENRPSNSGQVPQFKLNQKFSMSPIAKSPKSMNMSPMPMKQEDVIPEADSKLEVSQME
jgi:hypothetical protein